MLDSRKDLIKTILAYTLLGGVVAFSFYAYSRQKPEKDIIPHTAVSLNDGSGEDVCITSAQFIKTNVVSYPGSYVEIVGNPKLADVFVFPNDMDFYPDDAVIEAVGIKIKDESTNSFIIEGVPLKSQNDTVTLGVFMNDCMMAKAISITIDEWKIIKREQ